MDDESRPVPPKAARVAAGALLLALAVMALAPGAFRGGPVVQAPEAGTRALVEIDLNSADAATLELLPQIGPAIAQRIVEHRASHGPFRRLEDLDDVPGIGARRLEALRAFLRVGAGAAGGTNGAEEARRGAP